MLSTNQPDLLTNVPVQGAFEAYAAVAVDQPVDQAYTYGVPPGLLSHVRPGSLVMVPFGGRSARGCVVRVTPSPPEGVDLLKVRKISKILSPDFEVSPRIVSLALWVSEYYMSPPGDAIGCASFLGFNDVRGKTTLRYDLAEQWKSALEAGGASETSALLALTSRQARAAQYLSDRGTAATPAEIRLNAEVGQAVLVKLLEKGVLVPVHTAELRDDDYDTEHGTDTSLDLNASQRTALDRINSAVDSRTPTTFLLHGVTGSGKTEVYLQAIARTLDDGGSAIVLVPEIALTPQTLGRFRRRFGQMVGVYHSKLTLGQKFDLWQRVQSGECRIMIGARSAVFTPFPDLRIIILDEEHEATYKQDSSPRYHARDVAIVRAQGDKAVVILGSATPSVESYHKAKSGKFELLNLPDRIQSYPLPRVEVINMTTEAKETSGTSFLSRAMQSTIELALGRHEQTLLFVNRRGFFNFLKCLDCDTIMQCEHCDVSLTHHKPQNVLICHHCFREYVVPQRCPACDSPEVSLIGLGTQRVEEHVQELFPKASVLRIDLDSMKKRTAFIEAWREIERGEADIILGTQMIAKGFHLENVTVVGVPLADVALFQPDFRCAERAFASLTQVAGRAGRGEKPGVVIIQTYVPQHYAITYARNHDYLGFYEKEIRVREVLRFPPFRRLASVLATGRDLHQTGEMINEFSRFARDAAFRAGDEVGVLGPSPAVIAKLRDDYRWRVVLRCADHRKIKQVLRAAMEKYKELPHHRQVQLTIDIDPQDLL